MTRLTFLVIALFLASVFFTADWRGRDAAGYFERGKQFALRGDFSNAIADYTKVIKMEPDFVEAYRKRSVAYMYLAEHAKALADHNEVIRRNPGHAYAYYDRGITHYLMKNRDAACRDMGTACELGVENGCTQIKLAGCEQEAKSSAG